MALRQGQSFLVLFVLHRLVLTFPFPAHQNRSNVRRVVCVMIPGICAPDLGVAQPAVSTNLPLALTPAAPDLASKLPVMQGLFSHACPTKAPGERNRMHSAYQAFTTCPLTGAEKDRREKARKERELPIALSSFARLAQLDEHDSDSSVRHTLTGGQLQRTSDPSVYLLNREQMAEQAYPTPSPLPSPLPTNLNPTFSFDDWKRADGWVEAPYQPEREGPKRVLGLDCEMVSLLTP